MIGTISITDEGWYDLLSKDPGISEINFWKPSARRGFNAPRFSPFLFKLRAPKNAICGFAFFAQYSRLPAWLAWETFGRGNGCASFKEMQDRIAWIRQRIRFEEGPDSDLIGCVLLTQPVFFSQDNWIEQPIDWPVRTQSEKRYDLSLGEGLRIWEKCLAAVAKSNLQQAVVPTESTIADFQPRYGQQLLIQPRLGQGTFRIAVTDAYSRACAITEEHSLPALDAAHILPYENEGPHEVSNGILLRAGIHRLFDKGYITITPDFRVEVSQRLKTEYKNGKTYYPLHGRHLLMPKNVYEKPSQEFLEWHNENVFVA
jgi:putative restriction endonuclease